MMDTRAAMTTKPESTASGMLVQRACACGNHSGAGGECEECKKKRDEGMLQRAAIQPSASGSHPSDAPPIVHDVLRAPGQPLDAATRAFMEPRFGRDFSGVRVHTGANAAESARAVNALAYTVGRHVVFGAGQYAPGTGTGHRLLAHELTHVVQQRVSGILQTRLTVGDPHDADELQAESVAEEIEHSSRLSGKHKAAAVGGGRKPGAVVVSTMLRQPIRTSAASVLRRSRSGFFSTIGGFFISLFTSEESYSKERLDRYLKGLDKTNDIEGDPDSDDMARAVVKRWMRDHTVFLLTPKLKRLLIQEMLDGPTTKPDEDAILDLFETSREDDLRDIFGAGGVHPKQLQEDLDNKESQQRLIKFFARRYKGGLEAVLKGQWEMQPNQHQTPGPQPQPAPTGDHRPGGDTLRRSPSGGVAIQNGSLEWELRYVGDSGSVSGLTIGQGTDVDITVTFTRSGDTSKCPTITFLQTVRPTIGGMHDVQPQLLFTRERSSGASADVLEKETEPFYGAGPMAGEAGLTSEHEASLAGAQRGLKATFHDTPVRSRDAIPPGQTLVREFEVAVICVETGQTFGSLRWGYTKTRDGVITLTGAQVSDVQTQAASPQLEQVRRAFYSGFFQYSLSGFERGASRLKRDHLATLQSIPALGGASRIVLVGANDFSGGPEADQQLSLRRAEVVRDQLVRQGVSASLIVVEGHGVEAREPNPRGQQVPANRRVDIHIERGHGVGTAGAIGSAFEAQRLRRTNPRLVFSELIELLLDLQSTRGTIPVNRCNQLTHLADSLRRWRQLDPSVPDVDELYGEQIRVVRRRCASLIPRPQFEWELPPLQPPSFLNRILDQSPK